MVSLKGHKVYLDSNTIIYALEGVSLHLQDSLLKPLDAGVLAAVTSEVTIVETIVGPRKKGDLAAERELRMFLTSSPNFSIEAITLPILEKVIDLRVQYALKIPDAIHLATGILARCDVFVTGDQAWSKTGVTVIDPADIA